MARAQKRHAAACGKFYFRKDVYAIGRSGASSIASSGPSSPGTEMPLKKDKKMRNCFPPLPLPENGVLDLSKPVDEEYEEMTMNEIINGKGESFPGLLGLVYAYLETLEIEEKALAKIERYLDLIRRRANGSLQTPATWIRNFVRSHPDYKNNSVVSQKINYDLLVAVNEIERGVRHEPDLLPADYTGGDQDQGSIGL